MSFAPAAIVEGPPRLPMPYGLFSVASIADAATERWENGIQWEALNCGPAAVIVGDCDDPQGFPKTFPNGVGYGSASAFTVYAGDKCNPIGQELTAAQRRARATLEAKEQTAAELRLWMAMAADDGLDVLAGGGAKLTLGQLEKWIGDNYGSLGVIHASRNALPTLGAHGLISLQGGQLRTLGGTPVVAGSGYPGTGAAIAEQQVITITGSPTGGTFTLTFNGETTTALNHNASNASIKSALEALDSVQKVTVTGGPLPGSAVTVKFDSEEGVNIPQMTATSSLTGGTTPAVTPTTTVQGAYTAAAGGTEWVAASPSIFGYRGEVFEATNRPGDLLDRARNDLYGIAERNYLLGYDPCGVAFAPLTLGG